MSQRSTHPAPWRKLSKIAQGGCRDGNGSMRSNCCAAKPQNYIGVGTDLKCRRAKRLQRGSLLQRPLGFLVHVGGLLLLHEQAVRHVVAHSRVNGLPWWAIVGCMVVRRETTRTNYEASFAFRGSSNTPCHVGRAQYTACVLSLVWLTRRA